MDAPLGMADDAAAAALRTKGVGKKPAMPPAGPVVRAGATKIKGNLTSLANQADGVSKRFLTMSEARRAGREAARQVAINKSMAGPMVIGHH